MERRVTYPADIKYTKDHEWIRVTGDTGDIGVTQYAQEQLGDVVFVELPEVGQTFRQGDQFGSIESVKAVSDLFCPVSGEIVAVNTDLTDRPESVNASPHESWMIRIRLSDPGELSALQDADAYAALIA